MLIGVNGRFLLKPYTGIGQYTKYLFAEMATASADSLTGSSSRLSGEEVRFLMVSAAEVPEDVKILLGSNVEVAVLKPVIPGGGGLSKTYWEQVQLPRFLKMREVDMAHFPYPCNPWRGFEKPVVVTVHDTIPWTIDAYRSSWLSRLYHDRCRAALKKAARVLCVSQATKEDVAAIGIDEEVIAVTPNAPSPLFLKKLDEAQRSKVISRYMKGGRPYFLYVGGYDERKNVRTIVEVFQREIGPEFAVNLVLVGGKSLKNSLYRSFDEAVKMKEESANKGRVVVTGYVPEEDLPALYQGCLAFVTLSSKEGFNLPLVEAAVSGVPVVASDIPVHREVGGERALYCDPLDKAALGELLKRLAGNDSFYEHEKEKAMGYECSYSWEKTAKAVLKIYRGLL